MRVMWVGFKITEKQFKKMLELQRKGNSKTVKICPQAFIETEFLGRKFKFEDLVVGRIEEDYSGLLTKGER